MNEQIITFIQLLLSSKLTATLSVLGHWSHLQNQRPNLQMVLKSIDLHNYVELVVSHKKRDTQLLI